MKELLLKGYALSASNHIETYFNMFHYARDQEEKWRIYTQYRDANFSALIKRFEGNNEEKRNFLVNYMQPSIIHVQKL